jgi:hypothetical protein
MRAQHVRKQLSEVSDKPNDALNQISDRSRLSADPKKMPIPPPRRRKKEPEVSEK